MGLIDAITRPHAAMREIGLLSEADWWWYGRTSSGQMGEVTGIPVACHFRNNGQDWVLYVKVRKPGRPIEENVSETVSPETIKTLREWLVKRNIKPERNWYPLPW